MSEPPELAYALTGGSEAPEVSSRISEVNRLGKSNKLLHTSVMIMSTYSVVPVVYAVISLH
jgi:hypothetical protein